MRISNLKCLPKASPERLGWPWTEETDTSLYEERNSYRKISIVTPSFNQGEFLEETIRSVLLQNYPNLEYIIIDGGSTDNSLEIIKKYEPWISYWVSEKDKGQANALNKGIKKCSGEIFNWINSDDFFEKNTLYEVQKAFSDFRVNAICGTCIMFTKDNPQFLQLKTTVITPYSLVRYWNLHFCPPQPAIFFKREVFDVIGYLDESLHYSMDYDLWLRISKVYDFHFINRVFAYYRLHSNSKTGSEGEFLNFFPEWKMLSQKYSSSFNYYQLLKYRFSYFLSVVKTGNLKWRFENATLNLAKQVLPNSFKEFLKKIKK